MVLTQTIQFWLDSTAFYRLQSRWPLILISTYPSLCFASSLSTIALKNVTVLFATCSEMLYHISVNGHWVLNYVHHKIPFHILTLIPFIWKVALCWVRWSEFLQENTVLKRSHKRFLHTLLWDAISFVFLEVSFKKRIMTNSHPYMLVLVRICFRRLSSFQLEKNWGYGI